MRNSIQNHDERNLAAFYVHNPSAERLPLENFADHKARSILETLSKMEAVGTAVDSVAFAAAVCKMERLPCNAGELAAEVAISEASTWTAAIAETAEQAVKHSAERRKVEHCVRVAMAKLEADEPIEEILSTLQNHHQVSFGSFDPGPSEPSPPFPLGALGLGCVRKPIF